MVVNNACLLFVLDEDYRQIFGLLRRPINVLSRRVQPTNSPHVFARTTFAVCTKIFLAFCLLCLPFLLLQSLSPPSVVTTVVYLVCNCHHFFLSVVHVLPRSGAPILVAVVVG